MLLSQLNSPHMLHFSIPRISSPIFRTLNPIAHLTTHPDPKKEADFPRSQSAESHSSSSWSAARRQLPVIPGGNKFPPVIRISKAQLQQVNASSLAQPHCVSHLLSQTVLSYFALISCYSIFYLWGKG